LTIFAIATFSAKIARYPYSVVKEHLVGGAND
jgi:hypothetical protein